MSFVLAAPLMSWSGLFNNPQELGATVLILVAALFIGVGAGRLIPRDRGRTFFGTCAALAFVAVLAYFGVDAAGYVLWLLIAFAVVMAGFALVA